MNEPLDELLSGWLDDAQHDSVVDPDAIDQESCKEAAESLLIHGLLSDLGNRDKDRDEARIRALMQAIDSELQAPSVRIWRSPSLPSGRRRIAFLTTFVTVAAALLVMFIAFGPQQTVSAATALEMAIEAAMQPFDRTYTIRVVEEYPPGKQPRNLPPEAWTEEAEVRIDGATLYVRGADNYVLVRLLQDGGRQISGCNGEQSWAFREDSPVRVSSDLSRFRSGLPGHRQDIPFINIHGHLTQLQSGYEIGLADERKRAPDGTVLLQLTGIRKSRDVQGPKQVQIWFNPENGTVYTMLLDGLPRGRGGPKSVSLELVSQTDLGADFFTHESHHQPGRAVRYEELQR